MAGLLVITSYRGKILFPFEHYNKLLTFYTYKDNIGIYKTKILTGYGKRFDYSSDLWGELVSQYFTTDFQISILI